MHDQLFQDIALSIGAAWVLGVVAHWLRQPVILAYLVGGFLLGPSGLRLVVNEASMRTVSELGLIFLLFMIGLEIDLKKIRSAGRTITLTAAAQILGGCLLGVACFRLLGFPLGGGQWDALYLAIAAALSSTVIIVKILYDKRELDTVPGRITLGILVVQDLFAILFLAVQPNLGDLRTSVVLLSLARVAGLVAAALLLSRYVLPALFRRIARLPELLLVGALGWCFGLGELGARLHLSREMGALIAGVSLSTFPYVLDVAAKVTTLRDFFLTLFFVGIGMLIPHPTLSMLGWAAVLAIFVVVSRLFTTYTPLHLMSQGIRTSLLPAINLCQISEFSLVVIGLGLAQKHIDQEIVGVVAWAFVLLAAASTFAMLRSDRIVPRVITGLKRLGLRDLETTRTAAPEPGSGHGSRILLLGFYRTASSLVEELGRRHPELLPHVTVLDFNPQAFHRLRERGIRVIYGDLSQRGTLIHAGIEQAEVIVSTIPDSMLKGITNLKLVRQLRELNPQARIITTTEVLDDIPALHAAGANYVSVPRLDEASRLTEVLRAAEAGPLDHFRAELEARLKDRREVLP